MTLKDLDKPAILRLDIGDAAIAGFTSELMTEGPHTLHISYDTPLALCRQTHSLNIAVVDSPLQYPQDTDALITLVPGLAVGVRTADCVPTVICAPDIGAVAAVHAGWRGTLGNIVSLTIERLAAMGAEPARMHAAVGAGICQNCYEVDPELASKFRNAGFGTFIDNSHIKPHLDLKGINRRQLLDSGLRSDNIMLCDVCPRHTLADGVPLLPSYRRDHGTESRLVTFIVLKSRFNNKC